MSVALHSPAWLLLAVGVLLGLNFPLGKLATQAGVPGLVWAELISLGACTVLGAALWLWLRRGQRRPLVWDRQHRRYFVVTALVSYALPNVLVISCIPRLGSGMTAMMFTLSPLFTALLSRLAGLRAPPRLEYAGIVVGFAGALLVALARGEAGRPADWGWVALGVLVGAGLLGERYPASVWVGVGLIALGIGLTVWARRKG